MRPPRLAGLGRNQDGVSGTGNEPIAVGTQRGEGRRRTRPQMTTEEGREWNRGEQAGSPRSGARFWELKSSEVLRSRSSPTRGALTAGSTATDRNVFSIQEGMSRTRGRVWPREAGKRVVGGSQPRGGEDRQVPGLTPEDPAER